MNQSYEPLSICGVKKALILIILGKAELISTVENRILQSVNLIYPWPSVIRLKKFIHVPYNRIILTRKNIIKRDGHRCAYCKRADISLTIDHIQPKSRGGSDSWENLVACCIHCNNRKGNRTPEEAGMRLLIKPYQPDHIMLLINNSEKIYDSWKPFLFQ